MKKTVAIILLVVMTISSSMSVLAYTYPHELWSVTGPYERALQSRNNAEIIRYGNQIIGIMTNAPEGYEKRDSLVRAHNEVGKAYESLGDYNSALATFEKLYDYALQYESEFDYYIKTSKARISQYTPQITMYTDKGESPFFGAANEKENGVLYGMCYSGETRSKLDGESMMLTYQELGQELLSYNKNVMYKADQSGCAVEFALNCPNEGDDIRNISRMNSYLREISDLFKDYSDVPVYLRFGAEFDVWENQCDPDDFIAAFRHVSDYFKDRNSNVAIVWSPNQVSNWYVDIDDYYPGDDYVDWVGLSLYAHMYFQGDKTHERETEIVFKTGLNSNPVIAVKDIVEKYGNRKPIMISESGCGHKLLSSGENLTEFALQRLREYYAYLPMVYPQIKLIAYFDYMVNSPYEKYDLRLSANPQLQNEYLKLVKGPRYVQDSYSNTVGYCNRPVYNGINLDSVFEVSCYAHLYGSTVESVTYFIDDEYVGMSSQLPFTTYIDASRFSGKHRLKAIAAFDNGSTLASESVVTINPPADEITVEISGDEVYFDQPPVVYNSRTLVPMRTIFEELGARVTWDNDTMTATGKKGDRTVKVTIGQRIMYVNNNKVILDTAPIVLSGRTLVPARAVAEGLGCNVEWDDRFNLVSIKPKVFTWSDWETSLPADVSEDMYYIEKKTQYRYREREIEYFTMNIKINSSNYVGKEVSYGSWSSWQNEYISENSDRQVETRTQSSPKRYHYAHYCTGKTADKDNRYKTWYKSWSDDCSYHDLGWFDSPLPQSEDGHDNYAYYVNGKKYRCSNTCFRWYLIETDGGTYTQYRYRPVYTEYVYEEWNGWSDWSNWDDDDPYDYLDMYDDEVDYDVDDRIVYRYKEKN